MSVINKNLLKKFEYIFFKLSLVFLFSIFVFGYSPIFKKAYAINIYTIEDLDSIRNDLTGDHVLMNDLDFNGNDSYSDPTNKISYTTGEGWDPIGVDVSGSEFSGTFDGNGYTISNLYINNTTDEYVGLFGYTVASSSIFDIGVLNTSITSTSYAGILIGINYGFVQNSYSTGSVTGYYYVGGLVGRNGGAVSYSYSNASVNGDFYVGGLVGWNFISREIENSYSTGTVYGNEYVGGLVGYNDGSVDNSYSVGFLNQPSDPGDYFGGLVGDNGDVFGVVTDSFWDTETSGMFTSDGGTGKTTAEMMTLLTFDISEPDENPFPWDIIRIENFDELNPNIWYLDEGNDYPRLFWEFEVYNPEDSTPDNNVFHTDKRCHWKKPSDPTWIKLEPMVKDGVSGMNLTWVQYDADKITIKIDDGTDKYPWKIENTSNDGHEFLQNVSSWQNIMIKPTNHCREGEYSFAVSQIAYPYGWYGQGDNIVTLANETPTVPETGRNDILYLTISLMIIGFSAYLVLNEKSRRFALRDFERKLSKGL